jgi:hypothetical protein
MTRLQARAQRRPNPPNPPARSDAETNDFSAFIRAARAVRRVRIAELRYFFFADVDFFAEDFFAAVFFFGTFAPSFRACDRPIAIACFLLVTFFPERPLLSVPFFRSLIVFFTFAPAFLPYFAMASPLQNEPCIIKRGDASNGNCKSISGRVSE